MIKNSLTATKECEMHLSVLLSAKTQIIFRLTLLNLSLRINTFLGRRKWGKREGGGGRGKWRKERETKDKKKEDEKLEPLIK